MEEETVSICLPFPFHLSPPSRIKETGIDATAFMTIYFFKGNYHRKI
jgi:hypothetical protein